MATYYHNPRCSKSKQGLEILEAANFDFKIKEYLNEPLTSSELEDIIDKLGVNPIDVIRTKEELFKELNLDSRDLSQADWIQILVEYPKLLERPILVTKEKAVIGRPPENLKRLL